MPCFKSIVFYQYSPKTKLFLKKKMQNVQALGAKPPDPQNSPLNFEFLATRLPHFARLIITRGFVAFVLNNFFFIVQLQTL